MKSLKAVFGSLNTVDDILAYFNKLINKLGELEQAELEAAQEAEDAAARAQQLARERNSQASRANRIRRKLEELTN